MAQIDLLRIVHPILAASLHMISRISTLNRENIASSAMGEGCAIVPVRHCREIKRIL